MLYGCYIRYKDQGQYALCSVYLITLLLPPPPTFAVECESYECWLFLFSQIMISCTFLVSWAAVCFRYIYIYREREIYMYTHTHTLRQLCVCVSVCSEIDTNAKWSFWTKCTVAFTLKKIFLVAWLQHKHRKNANSTFAGIVMKHVVR